MSSKFPRLSSSVDVLASPNITKALMHDIEERDVGTSIGSRINKLSHSFKVLGVALVLPLLAGQAHSNEVTSQADAENIGAAMANRMFEGAYKDWQVLQAAKAERGPDINGPTEPTDLEAARKEFDIAIGKDLEARKSIGKDNPALRKAVESLTDFEALGDLHQDVKEGAFLMMYKGAVETNPTTAAFDMVIREKCKQRGVPEPQPLILEEVEIDM